MSETLQPAPCQQCNGRGVLWGESEDPVDLCPCGDGIDHLAVQTIRAEHAAVTPGPWLPVMENCDCNDGYGCSHGSWVHAVHLPDVPSWLPPEGMSLEQSVTPWRSRCEHSELSTMPTETAEFMARSWQYVQVLLARIDELEGGAR